MQMYIHNVFTISTYQISSKSFLKPMALVISMFFGKNIMPKNHLFSFEETILSGRFMKLFALALAHK